MADRFISGYAAMFGDETVIGGLFREKIAVGAFDRTLRENPDVLALWNHDTSRVLGRTTSNTLELRADRIGLWFAVTPDENTPDGATAIGTVGRGDVHQCSFGFYVTRQSWQDGEDYDLPLRIVEEVVLIEITLCALPAFPTTSASISDRSKKEHNDQNAKRRIAQRKTWREREIANARMKMRARGIVV